jgi:hypothetical protein
MYYNNVRNEEKASEQDNTEMQMKERREWVITGVN